jgi:hypothetical protein
MGFKVEPTQQLTTGGVVAANMYALDPEALTEGRIVPYLQEPFVDLDILDRLAQGEDIAAT